MRVWLERVGLVLLSVLLVVGPMEIGIRIWKRDVAFQPDPEFVRSFRPNVTRKLYVYDTPDVLRSLPEKRPSRPTYAGMSYTNNVGLRMEGDVGPKAEGERRILFLGDSFTEGMDVPDPQRFYRLVQESLDVERARVGRWRVINGAIQNGTPSQYILLLRRYLDQFQPDVVLAFISPNDPMDDFNFEDRYGFIFDSRGIPIRVRARFRLWLLQKSWFLRYLDVAAVKIAPEMEASFWPRYLDGKYYPGWVLMMCGPDPRTRDWFLKKTGRYIVELKRMTQERGAHFGVFLVQFMQIFRDEPFYAAGQFGLKEQIKKLGCLKDEGRPYQAFVEGFLTQSDIRFWNPYDAIRAEKARNPKGKLWNYFDPHFSPAGHRLIAEEVMRFLQSEFLRPNGTRR